MIQDSSLRAVLFDANNKMEMLITTITAAEEEGMGTDGMESITRPHKNIRSLSASKRNECSFDLKASSEFLIFISFFDQLAKFQLKEFVALLLCLMLSLLFIRKK